MTVFNVSGHADEIERLLGGVAVAPIAAESASDLREFGLESQLEDFLVENWASIPEFAGYEVYAEDGERVGQQYVTDIGRIDILARSADGKRWLVVELKKGKTSDDVVGQVLRYVGWVKRNEAGSDAEVRGLVIGSHEDERLKYALSTVPFVDSMTYAVSFSLKKSSL
jgi:restriction system protein